MQQLPKEAHRHLALIRKGGPFPYPRDGVAFGNREKLLPARERGWYREYTVPTPGERTRGARRIVAGRDGTLYYTDDHYRSFRRILGMSKLLQRLSDAAKSGVYRDFRAPTKSWTPCAAAALHVARIDLARRSRQGRAAARASRRRSRFPNGSAATGTRWRIACATFPGRRRRATCCCSKAPRRCRADERGILVDILASAAASWAERKRPFFAVFLDGPPALPELYNDRR